MVKNTQTIRRLSPTNCLRVFDHFVGLALKGLSPRHNIMSNPQELEDYKHHNVTKIMIRVFCKLLIQHRKQKPLFFS